MYVISIAFVETTIPFSGSFEAVIIEDNKEEGISHDEGNYSIFDGIRITESKYSITPDQTRACGSILITQYIISENNSNSITFESTEIWCTIHADGKYGTSNDKW